MKGLELYPAKVGGFMVMEMGPYRGELKEFLFAGSLEECLDFIRKHYSTENIVEFVKRGSF